MYQGKDCIMEACSQKVAQYMLKMPIQYSEMLKG